MTCAPTLDRRTQTTSPASYSLASPNRFNCLYMTKTTSAIMMKYMICEMKSPYRNTDGFPETGEVTVAFSDDRFPVGRYRPTIGLMMSLTSELTTADDATPMTKPSFFSEAFSILSMTARSELQRL